MRNVEVRNMHSAHDGALLVLMNQTRLDEKKNQHMAIAARIAKLTIQIQQQEMTVSDVIELLSQESERFEHSAQELSA